jgi:hypothetical protein
MGFKVLDGKKVVGISIHDDETVMNGYPGFVAVEVESRPWD